MLLSFFSLFGLCAESGDTSNVVNRGNSCENSSEDDTISICMATDDNYAQHAGVTIASILTNAAPSDKLKIYILHKNLSKKNIAKLKQLKSIRNFELAFRNVGTDTVNHLKLNHKELTLAAWFRLFIPELCPDCKNKILYMDVDMIVLKSLKELWNTNLNGYCAAVVDDFTEIDGKYEYKKNVLKLPPPYRYFNSGLILFNLQQCAKDKIFDNAIKFGLENSYKLKFEDQDTLNVVMYGKLLYLPIKYNLQNGNPRKVFLSPKRYTVLKFAYQSCIEAFKDPVIIHYVSNKPWNFFSNHPYRELYYKYLQLTPWKNNYSILASIRYKIVMCARSLYFGMIDFILNRKLPV